MNYFFNLFIHFSFWLRCKKKSESKRKTQNNHNTAFFRQHKTANAVTCVFALQAKIFFAQLKTNLRNLQSRPLRSEQSLFATRVQGGICLSLRVIPPECGAIQMISERSIRSWVSFMWLSLPTQRKSQIKNYSYLTRTLS